jgi:hypothetical protein
MAEYKISKQQEHFCRLVAIEGKPYVDAYREAYDSSASQAGLYVKGSVLAKSHKIRVRMDEIRKEITSGSIMDARERQELWSDIARNKGERTRDRLAATELLGKKQKDFVTSIESQSLNVNLDLSGFTTEDLRLMLAHIKQTPEDLLQLSQGSVGEE